jgi:hypothetical protein
MMPNLAQRAPPKLTHPIGLPTEGLEFHVIVPCGWSVDGIESALFIGTLPIDILLTCTDPSGLHTMLFLLLLLITNC